ncbi:MAG TPA: hypothetical protein VEG60_04305 [Candidatus Binatia bacterium]|nr:hypothetical protein [Candidatus Binatia bacterium]
MKRFLVLTALAASLLFMSIADLHNSSFGPGFVNNAVAIIGLPRTPLSFAGVARRSMYRGVAVATTAAVTSAAATSAAAANAAAAQAAAANTAASSAAAQPPPAPGAAVPIGTIVPNLPSGCSSVVIGGVEYFNCAGVYYRAGFQGNNIVYIVSAP